MIKFQDHIKCEKFKLLDGSKARAKNLCTKF